MTPDLDKLAALAGATERFSYDPWDSAVGWDEGEGDQAGRWNHAAYLNTAGRDLIAALSPDVVLALIERVRAAEALLRERAAMEYDIADDADRAAEAEFLRPIGGGL